MYEKFGQFFDGKWQQSSSGETYKVINPANKSWGIGQVQSIINDKVTVNFQNVGKKVINAKNIELERIDNNG